MAVAAQTLSLRVRRGVDRAALILLFLVALLVIAVAGLSFMGLRVLVVQSGSMAPAIDAGDVVVVRMVMPSEVEVGDIVTFNDKERGRLVTHRVEEIKPEADNISFTTRGDANTGTEQWSLVRSGSLGKVDLRIPSLGYVARAATYPVVFALLLIAVVLAFGVWGLRRIWATP